MERGKPSVSEAGVRLVGKRGGSRASARRECHVRGAEKRKK